METLKEKVTIITGASSGIGRGVAIYFAKYGAKLVLTGRSEKGLNETKELCKGQTPDNILLVVADVCKSDDRKKIVDETVKKFGQINVLVNNAGIYIQCPFENITEDDYDKTMATNVKQAVFLSQLCLPYLIAQKGSIVNLSSVCASRSYAEQMTYCMSKAAMDQFTRCLAIEMAPKKVRVNSVNPGGVVTNLYKGTSFCPNEEEEKKLWDWEAKLHPLGRNGEIEEIASAVAYLSSDHASFITGESLFVDGGRQIV